MAWNSGTNLGGGAWQNWTPTFNTGTDLWNASNMTYYNCRWTMVEGTVYALGNFTLAAGTNYGNGTEVWTLWTPPEMPRYVDTDTGGRMIGKGHIYDNADPPTNAAVLNLNAVNNFTFFYFDMIRYTVMGGGNWNNGTYNRVDFKRSELSSLAGGNRALYVSWYMKYIGETNY